MGSGTEKFKNHCSKTLLQQVEVQLSQESSVAVNLSFCHPGVTGATNTMRLLAVACKTDLFSKTDDNLAVLKLISMH